MPTQTIAVIGAAGTLGSAIAESISGGKYRVLLFDSNVSALEELKNAVSKETPDAEVEIAGCQQEACWEADVIVLAVPYAELPEVVDKIKKVATQKIVISISNPMNKTLDESSLLAYKNALSELKQQLPYSRIVRVLDMNIPGAEANSKPAKKPDVYLDGDHEKALAEVEELLKEAGMNPIIIRN